VEPFKPGGTQADGPLMDLRSDLPLQASRHMKGVVVEPVVRYVRKCIKAGTISNLVDLGDRARGLLEGAPIVPSTWYDYDAYFELMHTIFTQPLRGDLEALAGFSAAGAKLVYCGVHSSLIQPGRPLETIRNVRTQWKICHDFGRAESERGDHEAIVHVRDAVPMSEIEGYINAGWIGGILASAGANGVRRNLVARPWQAGEVLTIHYSWS